MQFAARLTCLATDIVTFKGIPYVAPPSGAFGSMRGK
jgi:hypothetical protein